jgi:hypothetical protein
VSETFFDVPVHYRDFAEFEQRMIGVTGNHRLDAATAAVRVLRATHDPDSAHFVGRCGSTRKNRLNACMLKRHIPGVGWSLDAAKDSILPADSRFSAGLAAPVNRDSAGLAAGAWHLLCGS